VGTGLNLPHYPDHVRKITTADPNPGMNKRLQRRIDQTGIEVDKHVLGSEELPFNSGTFDCVVSTITLCSIPSVEQALEELYRVLKPGGRMLYLEHGASPDPKVCKWQRRLNWVQGKIGDGCRLDLDVRGLLATQPFGAVEIDNFYMERTPRTHGYMYRGVAVK
jgi:ubiquinone/menaquinone biosynthesis C-methylase UbiE